MTASIPLPVSNSPVSLGTYAGQAVTIATIAVNPAAAAGAVGWVRTAQTALNAMNMSNGAISAGEAYRNGDTLGVVTSLAGAGLSSLRGMGSVCQNAGRFARFGTVAAQTAAYGQRALWAYGVGQGAASGVRKVLDGDPIGGALDNLTAGTPIAEVVFDLR